MASTREKVDAERENISRALHDLQFALTRPQITVIEKAAIATFMHNVYTGMENILKQILKAKGATPPHTQTSHKDLLALAVTEHIISQAVVDAIFPYLSFRHFFVHSYGFMLEEDPIERLALNISAVYSNFEVEIEKAIHDLENTSAASE